MENIVDINRYKTSVLEISDIENRTSTLKRC